MKTENETDGSTGHRAFDFYATKATEALETYEAEARVHCDIASKFIHLAQCAGNVKPTQI